MPGLYPQETIDRVREAVDIVDVISSYLPLKKSGANHTALCPFHTEKTPSFSVSQSKQIFHCFGCGEGGNAISFVMKYEKRSFVEAIQMLAEQAGIALPKKKGEGDYSRLYDINLEAARFYRDRLKAFGGKGPVAAYIENRKIAPQTIEEFWVGFAPDAWDACLKHLQSKKFRPDEISKAGITKKSSSGNFIDRFRNRVIFPILDERKRVIAFGGRAIGEGQEPKYLNSPDSPVYNKSRAIYGLNLAAEHIRKQDEALVVEGYTDVLSLSQAGIKNAVASAGTAFTVQQCRILKRHTSNFVMIFDGDEAGRKAAARATKIAMELNLRPKVAMLPQGQDPDSLASSGKADEFLEIVKKAKPYMSYMIDLACREFDIDSAEGRSDAVRSLLPDLAGIADAIERSSYVQAMSERFKIPADKIERRLGRPTSMPRTSVTVQNRIHPGELQTEKVLIRIMLDHPEIVGTKLKELKPEDFQSPTYRHIFKRITETMQSGGGTIEEIAEKMEDDEMRKEMRALALERAMYDEEEWDKNVDDYLSRIRSRARKKLIDEMKRSAESGSREEYLAFEKNFRKPE